MAFSSDFTMSVSDKSLGLKHSRANGMLTYLMAHSLEGLQKGFIPFFQVGVSTCARMYTGGIMYTIIRGSLATYEF